MSETDMKNIHTERGNFSVGSAWGGLRKAWKGYRIALVKNEVEKQKEYANRIRALQTQLNLTPATFPKLGIE